MVLSTESVIKYFSDENVGKQIDFDKKITHVAADMIGKSIAVGCDNELHILSFLEASKQEVLHIFDSPIRRFE